MAVPVRRSTSAQSGEGSRGILRHRAHTVGQFRYEILLPGDIDPDQVTASLSCGVLSVRLTKPTSEKPKRIKVQ